MTPQHERALQRLMFAVFDSPPRWSGTDWIMLSVVVDEALATLRQREIIVTQMRVGLTPRSTTLRPPIQKKYAHTFAEIGLALNISAERVRQIWSKSLRKLRHPTRSRPFRVYYQCLPRPSRWRDDEEARSARVSRGQPGKASDEKGDVCE